MIDNKEQYERTLQWLEKFKADLADINPEQELWFMKAYRESIESQIEDLMTEINDYEEETQAWEEYLIRIGVTDLTNEEEISQKLDEVERNSIEYKVMISEALEEISAKENKPLENINKKDIESWLLSLGD